MASKINDYIRGFFKCFEKTSYGDAPLYENNDCFKYFFKIRRHENDTLGAYYLVPAFLLLTEIEQYKNTNIPIQLSNRAIPNLSETTLLSELGKKSFYNNRTYHIHKLKTKAGETYYGTNGIILDADFNILIMVVLKMINNNIADSICYINPKVFDNEKGTVEKIIIKKMLPFICLHEVSLKATHLGFITPVFKDVTKQYIKKPVEPQEDFCDEYANNLLIEWEDEILDYLEEHFNE